MRYEIKRPFAAAGLIVFITDIIIMMTSPEIVFPAVLISAAVTAVFTAKKSNIALLLFFCVIFSGIAGISFRDKINGYEKLKNFTGRNLDISGTAYDYPEIIEDRKDKLIINNYSINNTELKGKLTVYSESFPDIHPGDKISLNASEIILSADSGIYKYHRLSSGEYLTAFSNSEIVSEPAEKFSLQAKTAELRNSAGEKLFRNMSYDSAALADALITGSRDSLSEETELNFRIAGASHILAVSGMHLAIWTGFFFIIFSSRSRISFIPNLAAVLFVLFYMAFTGFSPSVIRSGVMLITVFAGAVIKRKADPVNSLGLAALILLTVNPFLAGNLSFLLSFAATAALTITVPALFPETDKKLKNNFIAKTGRNIKNTVFISLCVLLCILPLSSIFFGYISLLSPLSTLLITPAAEFLMITGGAGLLLPESFILSKIAFYAVEKTGGLIIYLTEFLSRFDFAVFPLDKTLIISWFAISFIFCLFIYFHSAENKKAVLLSVLCASFILISVSAGIYFSEKNNILLYFPEAGENTNFCITDSSGSFSVVFGSGGNYKSCSDCVSFLNSHTAFKADIMIIPTEKETENKNTDYFMNRIFPENKIILSEDGNIPELNPDIGLRNNIHIKSEISETAELAAINIYNKKIIVCTLPSTDFNKAGSIYSSGDILICRSKIPLTADIDNFKKIVVMSKYNSPYKNEKILSTADNPVTIKIKGEDNASH